jgi:hypothetical protein
LGVLRAEWVWGLIVVKRVVSPMWPALPFWGVIIAEGGGKVGGEIAIFLRGWR